MEFIRIYDRAFKEIGVCSLFTHLIYTEDFREAGTMSLTVPLSSHASELFIPDGYVTVPEGTMYRILSVDRDMRRGEVKISGRGLLSLFEGTVIGEEYSTGGSVSVLLLSLARKCAANLPAGLTVASVTDGDLVDYSLDRSDIYGHMVSLCYLGGVGMKLEYIGEKLSFSPIFPRDRTAASADPVSVSGQMGTFTSERFHTDLSGYRNVVVVSGAEKESGGRYTVTVRSDSINIGDSFPDRDYFDRQMTVLFTVPLSQYTYENNAGEKVLDEASYISDMRASGAAALGRCRPVLRLYGTADAEATRIAVGDLVQIADSASGVTGTALAQRRVTEYSENGKSVRTELCAEVQPE